MKIYTKTGDEGTTSLFMGGRVPKDDIRLHAYGTVDELNAVLGMVVAHGVKADLADSVERIQGELFIVGADLATPLEAEKAQVTRVHEAMVTRLEEEIDAMDEELPSLKNFILPGGSPAAASLHHARTVCRRAERHIVSLGESANSAALRYINRLADWLFMAARFENHRTETPETVWKPGG